MYKHIQEKKRNKTSERIQHYSNCSRENIKKGFKECLDILRTKHNQKQNEEEFGQQNEGKKKQFRTSESPCENLGFPDNMMYEKRAQLRKECSKFIRFSYLIDFIALESLKNVYQDSVDEVIQDFKFMVQQSTENIVLYKDKGLVEGRTANYKEPQFSVQLDFSYNNDNLPLNKHHF